jgi:hypothetical protein
MTDDNHACECCADCGRDFTNTGVFCRFYLEGSRVSLCNPACATSFLRRAEPCAAAPEGDLIAELVEEWRWTWGHKLRPVWARATADKRFANGAEPAASERARVVSQLKLSDLLSHENRSCAY